MEKIIGSRIIGPISSVCLRGLLAWWKHDEGSGLVLHDYIGGYNGVVRAVESEYWNNADCGTYDGTDDDVNEIGNVLDFDDGDSITLIYGIYSAIPTNRDFIFVKRNDTVGNYQFCNYGIAGEARLEFNYYGGGGWHNFYTHTADFTYSANTWYIVTFQYTFGTGNTAAWKINNVAKGGSWFGGDGDSAPDSSGTQYVHIGSQDNAGDDSGNNAPWQGRLRDILLYKNSVQLTAAEVMQSYNGIKARYGL